jgi:DNA-binding IclR family transcriptional regulator
MASMSTEIAVLRALLRFSRRRTPATLEDVVASVRDDAADVERALGSLARAQLVQRDGASARLSLAGLAVAVAAAARAKAARRRPKAIDARTRTRSEGALPISRRAA